MKVFSAESMVDFDKLERIKEERKKFEFMENELRRRIIEREGLTYGAYLNISGKLREMKRKPQKEGKHDD